MKFSIEDDEPGPAMEKFAADQPRECVFCMVPIHPDEKDLKAMAVDIDSRSIYLFNVCPECKTSDTPQNIGLKALQVMEHEPV